MRQEDIDIRQLLPTGTLLQGGKYRVDRYLSSGNFGNTYVVTNTGMKVQFAMKEFFLRNICYRTNSGAAVSISPAVDPEKVDVQREKFMKEAQRLYGLKSQHLVHVHDMFEENNTVYYVMDFVKGESLAHYMERTGKPLTEEQTRFILHQLLDGLEEIHQKKIYHLDLKPDNVMIDNEGNVVIIDFGASKQVGRSGKYTGTSGILCYTPGYAPAEQVNQDLDSVGPWTDIYALGATLYNLLTNIEPSTQNAGTLTYPPSVNSPMRQLITKMMMAGISQRPQSVAEVRQLLSSVDTPAPTSSRTSKPNRTSRPPGWMKWSGIAAAVVAVVLLGIVLLSGDGKQEQVLEQLEENVESVEEVVEESSMIEETQLVEKDPLGLCPNNSHPHAIDMGDGIKWACCNVGAKTPIEYGDAFAWGETKPKESYSWKNYEHSKSPNNKITKYCFSSSNGVVDNKITLDFDDDAARVNWGDTWRMPMNNEMESLNTHCKWNWTVIEGVKGYVVTASNGNMLFFPAAGDNCFGRTKGDIGSVGKYWSSSLVSSDSYCSYDLEFERSYHYTTSCVRCHGKHVRPVKE